MSTMPKGIESTKAWARDLVSWARRDGLSKEQAAKRVGLHVNTLHRILQKHGLAWWRAKPRRRADELPRPWETIA